MHPTYLYHPTEAPTGRKFTDEAAYAALGPDWVDTPTKFPTIPVEDTGKSGAKQTTGNADVDAVRAANLKNAVPLINAITDEATLATITETDARAGVKNAVAARLAALKPKEPV